MDGAAKFYHKDLYLRYAVALDKPLVLQLQNWQCFYDNITPLTGAISSAYWFSDRKELVIAHEEHDNMAFLSPFS